MATVDLLAENPNPSVEEIKDGIEGNLCRCTGYQNIIKAVQAASGAMSTAASGAETPVESQPAPVGGVQ